MIYLDNAATTFPKPPEVINEVTNLIENFGGNPGRGGHRISRMCAEKVYSCRENLSKLINNDNPERIVFTKNTTEALNLAIKGCLKEGDEVIISSMEHNSVLRSVISLEKLGVSAKIARADSKGYVSAECIKSLITPKTKLVCVVHSSNVVGTVNPIDEICKMAREKGVYTLVDCAQSGGIIPIECKYLDMAAFAGHKGLFGPFGTGALYIREGIELDPLLYGGTGSMSESATMPSHLPDRFEAGTLNAAGIAGLNEGIKFVMREGVYEKETLLTKRLVENLSVIKGVKVLGIPHAGAVGVLLSKHDPVDISSRLDSEYDIAVRSGLHCSPLAHRTLGTITSGLLRFSPSFFNTIEEIDYASGALNKVIN